MKSVLLREVNDFIDELSSADSAKILADIRALELGLTEAITVKTLRGKIKELVIKRYRVIFFAYKDVQYIVDVFVKKSQKTPPRVIEKAEEIFRKVKEGS